MLTAQRLRELLIYDPRTGVFRWLVSTSNRVKVGAVAGNTDNHYGYRLIGVDGRLYRGGRLAWLYMTGEWPPDRVDHKNRNRLDDRWDNLRPCSHGQNIVNSGLWKHNKSGFKGVYLNRHTGRWRAKIQKDGKTIHLGSHDTPEEAHAAYQKEARRLFGEFAD